MTAVHHRYAAVCGQRLFCREAGPAGDALAGLTAGLLDQLRVTWYAILRQTSEVRL
jgi:hypothetical protein